MFQYSAKCRARATLLESLEASFNQDLNGDGRISPPVTVLDGHLGNQTLTAAGGPTVLVGGPRDTLNGGAGADMFVFPQSFGAETVKNFTPGTDALVFSQAMFANVAAVLADAHQVGSNVRNRARSAERGHAAECAADQPARVRFPSRLIHGTGQSRCFAW